MGKNGLARATTLEQWNRFAHVPRWVAGAVLALLIGVMIYGTLGHTGSSHIKGANSTAMKANGLVGDHALYSEIVRRVGEGQNYYTAATGAQRENGYPTKPFLTVRFPTYALIMATLGEKGTQLAAMLIAGLAIGLWYQRLRYEEIAPNYAHFGALLMVVNISQPLTDRSWLYMHESITGALIALALALYRPDRIWPALIVMAVTVAIRETALPVAMIFGMFALWDRNWRASGAWLALGFAFLAMLGLHILAIEAARLPADHSSPGWSAGGGWLAYASFVFKTSLFHHGPDWTGAVIIPLALLGWASWKARLGTLCFAVQIFYMFLFMFAARPDNFYWGILVVPTLFIGLIFAPGALIGLVQSLVRGRTKPVPALPA